MVRVMHLQIVILSHILIILLFSHAYLDLAWACLTELANAPNGATGKPLLSASTVSAVEEFAKKKSNISLIHYYPSTVSQEDGGKMACGEHKGTCCFMMVLLFVFLFVFVFVLFFGIRECYCTI